MIEKQIGVKVSKQKLIFGGDKTYILKDKQHLFLYEDHDLADGSDILLEILKDDIDAKDNNNNENEQKKDD